MTWYVPGTSPLHRAPAGWKLLAVFVLAAVIFLLRQPVWLGVLSVLAVSGYALARIPLPRSLRLARGVLLLVLAVFALQSWLLGVGSALVVCLRIFAALAVANLFTLTTRIDDLVAAIERATAPLARFGLRPDRLGLLVGLTLQAIAALSAVAVEVREAAKARGAGGSPTAFAVPFLVRTLRHADELGEALAARGEGD